MLADCLDVEAETSICKRLDVYLKGLSNWRDLGRILLGNEHYLNCISKSSQPTSILLNQLFELQITVGDFSAACKHVRRGDVLEDVRRALMKRSLPQDQLSYLKEWFEFPYLPTPDVVGQKSIADKYLIRMNAIVLFGECGGKF